MIQFGQTTFFLKAILPFESLLKGLKREKDYKSRAKQGVFIHCQQKKENTIS